MASDYPRFTQNKSVEEIKERLLKDPEFIKGIKEGMAAMKEGKTTPWSEVKKELGIEDAQ